MKSFASLVWLLVLSSTVHGQMFAPALMVQEDGHPKPLGLAKLQTEVRVVGAIAETTTTMTFTNPTWNIVEGYLYFPLPEGATVSSYALDIDGTMVDGVAVEKVEARRIFTDLETRRIDPGLVEWTKQNTFQARVFPIPAHGSRRIRVGYVSELASDHTATIPPATADEDEDSGVLACASRWSGGTFRPAWSKEAPSNLRLPNGGAALLPKRHCAIGGPRRIWSSRCRRPTILRWWWRRPTTASAITPSTQKPRFPRKISLLG